MNEINVCISSNVVNNYVLTHYNIFVRYLSYKEKSIGLAEIDYEKEICLKELIMLNKEIKHVLEDLFQRHLLFPSKDSFGQIVELEFDNKKWPLNYRDTNDFSIATLITCYNLFNRTIELKGSIYLFNRQLINIYGSDKLIAILKGERGLTFNDIEQIIIKQRRDIITSEEVNSEILMKGLSHLQKLGYVFCDKFNLFSLTAKGSMLVL